MQTIIGIKKSFFISLKIPVYKPLRKFNITGEE